MLFIVVTGVLFHYEVTRIRSEKAERADSSREIPDFRLVDQHGQIFRRRDLAGRVWIFGLVSASADDRDGAVVGGLSDVIERVADIADVGAVLISVTPEKDEGVLGPFVSTLPVPEKWVALTGERARVADLVRVGLGGRVSREGSAVRIERSSQVAVVDRRGRLRASLDANDGNFNEQALTAVKHALAER